MGLGNGVTQRMAVGTEEHWLRTQLWEHWRLSEVGGWEQVKEMQERSERWRGACREQAR